VVRLVEEARADGTLVDAPRSVEPRFNEEAQLADEARIAEEVRLVREARTAEKARAAEEARRESHRYDEAVHRAEEARVAQQARLDAEARASEAASFAQHQFAASTNGWSTPAELTQEPSWGDLIPGQDAPSSDPQMEPPAQATRSRAAPSYAVRPPQVVDEATAENELWRIVAFESPPTPEPSPFEAAFDGVDANLDANLESIISFSDPQPRSDEPEPEIELTELSWAETSIPPLMSAGPPELEPDLLEDDLADPSDSTEAARLRRQKLLRKAMENIGALNGPRPEPEAAAPTPAPQPVAPPTVPNDANELAARIEQHHARLGKANRFELLGLTPQASRNDVKAAFLNLAKVFHPDRLPPSLAHLSPKITAVFESVRESYEHLYDDARRADYARSLQKPAAPAPKPVQRTAGGESAAEAARRGEALLRKRDFHGAEEAFAQADATEPNAAHRAAQAWALYLDPTRKSELARAKQMMTEAIKADPQCDRAHYQLGVIARVEGDLDRAERFFREALNANPRHLEANQEIRLIEMRKAKSKKGLFGR
jgi:curved DNA-binding protein CbpA